MAGILPTPETLGNAVRMPQMKVQVDGDKEHHSSCAGQWYEHGFMGGPHIANVYNLWAA